MLETKIDELIAALKANTAAHGGAAAPAATRPPAGAKTATKVTFDQVKAAVVEVKDNLGKPAAVKIITEAGKAKELASIKPPQFQAVLDACAEVMTPAEDDAPADDADDTL